MWTEERRIEMSKMQSMLYLIVGLNRGSNFLGKIEDIMNIAEELTHDDVPNCKMSFSTFIKDEALKID